MNHDYVVDHDVIGRYRSRQLPPEEASVFEAHLTECDECRALLDADIKLERGIRAIAGAPDESRRAEYGRLLRKPWYSTPRIAGVAAAAISSMAVIMFWASSLPPSPQAGLPVFELLLARGTTTDAFELHVPKDASWYSIELESPLTDESCCRVLIEDSAGRQLWNSGVLVVDESRQLRVLLHRDFLRSGNYRIVICAAASNGVRLLEHEVLLRIDN